MRWDGWDGMVVVGWVEWERWMGVVNGLNWDKSGCSDSLLTADPGIRACG